MPDNPSMIERVTLTLVDEFGDRITYADAIHAAHAVLNAMREPTGGIRIAMASGRFRTKVSADEHWRAMIDAALSDKPK